MKKSKIKFILNTLLLNLVLVPTVVQAGLLNLDPLITLSNYSNPEITVSSIEEVFPDNLKPLWVKALNRPEADYQRLAATTIALAHMRGMKGLEDTIPDLVKLLNREELHPTVKLAVVEALVELDAKDHAELLAEIAQSSGIDLQFKIEPALAKWNYEPYKEIWLQRIKGNGYSRTIFTLALKCLIVSQEEKAIDRLLELAKNPSVPDYLRFTAATGLGTLKKSGLIDEAMSLFQLSGLVNEYIAVSIIKHHEGEKCDNAMKQFGMSKHPVVTKVALKYFLAHELYPSDRIVENALTLKEPAVRVLGVESLKRFSSEKRVEQLLGLFKDGSFEVRRSARQVLEEYSKDEKFKDTIVKKCRELIESTGWREVEQAMILLVKLKDKHSATKFVKLLRHENLEVSVTAAWGLRKFAVITTLVSLGEELVRLVELSANNTPAQNKAKELKGAQLILLIGELGIPFPQDKLAQLISANVLGVESSVAAIWTLGELNEGKEPRKIVRKLIGIILTFDGDNPADERLRRMSAIALGRMKSKSAIPALKKHFQDGLPTTSTANWACGWALEQITGEKMVPVKPLPKVWNDWFLKPVQ